MWPIQRQRLAAFNLKGDANKLYKMQFLEEDRLSTTQGVFIRRFNLNFISVTLRARKEAKLLTVEYGDMTVSTYEDMFFSLSHFTDNMF